MSKLSERLKTINRLNRFHTDVAKELSAIETEIAELEVENHKLKEDAITVVRNTFESSAIEAWKKHCAELEARIKELEWKIKKANNESGSVNEENTGGRG